LKESKSCGQRSTPEDDMVDRELLEAYFGHTGCDSIIDRNVQIGVFVPSGLAFSLNKQHRGLMVKCLTTLRFLENARTFALRVANASCCDQAD
jgi:hypothetical protein